MKKTITFLCTAVYFLLAAQLTSFAQTAKKNSVYAEFLGNGGLYSVNYDRVFQLDTGIKIVPRVGLATFERIFIVPLEVNVLLSKSNTSKNFFETGLGVTILKPLKRFSGELLTMNGYNYNFNSRMVNTPFIIRAGFRHQKPSGGFMYRTGVLLFTGKETLLTIGIGLGYTF